jgi:hypothetical protein
MTEKLTINGTEVWVVVEAQDAGHSNPNAIPTEYFIAWYNLQEPGVYSSSHEPGKIPGKLFKEENEEAKRFLSPVEAIEYAVENLPGILHS